jgi:hypothetical protein
VIVTRHPVPHPVSQAPLSRYRLLAGVRVASVVIGLAAQNTLGNVI